MVKFVPLPPTIYMENAKGTTNFIIKVLHINITMDILDNTLTTWLRYIYIYIYIYILQKWHINLSCNCVLIKIIFFLEYIFDAYVVKFALNIKTLILYCEWAK